MSVQGCPYLTLANIEPGCWSFHDVTDGERELPRRVGPLYPTKEAALEDFRRYAYESWGWGEKPQTFPRFEPITVAQVDAHDGEWLILVASDGMYLRARIRPGRYTQTELTELFECGMPLDDEGQPTTVKEG